MSNYTIDFSNQLIANFNDREVVGSNIQKANTGATTDPTGTNDYTEGYGIGSVWINTTGETVFICVDDSSGAPGAAKWVHATFAGDSLQTAWDKGHSILAENKPLIHTTYDADTGRSSVSTLGGELSPSVVNNGYFLDGLNYWDDGGGEGFTEPNRTASIVDDHPNQPIGGYPSYVTELKSLKVEAINSNAFKIRQPDILTAGTKYRISFWVKIQDEGSGEEFSARLGSTIYSLTSPGFPGPDLVYNEWIRVELVGVATSSSLEFGYATYYTDCSVTIHGVEVVPIENSSAIIQRADGELELTDKHLERSVFLADATNVEPFVPIYSLIGLINKLAQPVYVTSSTDGEYIIELNTQYPRIRKLCVEGTATNFTVRLINVASGRNREFIIKNMTPNFIGVARSDYTNMKRVGPGGTITIVGDGTNWHYDISEPKSYAKEDFEFIGGTTQIVSHTGRVYSYGGGSGVFGHQETGGTSMYAGISHAVTDSGDACVWIQGNATTPIYSQKILNKGVPYQAMFLALRYGAAAPTAGVEFNHRLGLLYTVTADVSTYGVFFSIDESKEIKGIVRNAASDKEFSSGIDLSSTELQKLIMEVNHDTSRADFWINDTHIDQPSGSYTITQDSYHHTIHSVKTAGASEREVLAVDRFAYRLAFGTHLRGDV